MWIGSRSDIFLNSFEKLNSTFRRIVSRNSSVMIKLLSMLCYHYLSGYFVSGLGCKLHVQLPNFYVHVCDHASC